MSKDRLQDLFLDVSDLTCYVSTQETAVSIHGPLTGRSCALRYCGFSRSGVLHLQEKPQMGKGKKVEVRPGDRYGKLVVIREVDRRVAGSGQRCRRVLCQCDCGSTVTKDLNQLRHRKNPCCGCLRGGVIKHGASHHQLYNVWRAFISRCENPSDQNYDRYGGRGIDVCKEWHDLDTFLAWGLANGWMDGLVIDRIDNNGGYRPDNCRFVSHKESQRNTRHNHNLTHDGETMCLAAWAERTGVSYTTIAGRIKRGWSARDALSKSVNGGAK